MQQISRFKFTAFTVSELLRENQHGGGGGGGGKITPSLNHSPPQHTHPD